MRLSFRRRLFLAIVGLGTLPLAVALVVLALQVRSSGSTRGARATLDEIALSGGRLVEAVDTTALDSVGREALRSHTETIGRQTNFARRADRLNRISAGVLGFLLLLVAIVLVATSLMLARRWSRYVSAPIEELVDWVRRVERQEQLPAASASRGAPEFDALRHAVRDMAGALEQARERELEQERLRAFRETARRVAHEMRGPVSAARLALRRLSTESDDEMLAVVDEETERLERMAAEFSDFGRLPEGAEADIDVNELVESVLTAAVPADIPVECEVTPGATVRGHYEPLRRALQNLLRNAVEASQDGPIRIVVVRSAGGIEFTISDSGPGIPAELRQRIFEPYFTTKKRGTGLGLALVKQTVLAHRGTIAATDAAGGGTSFVITLPEGA
ncbi:MAG: HAMP domain-containing histidine kinase [Gemmatimonadota bacterium]|nr:MAG: HAMP domain-containing histidine kinase [Gemmatimonadota bacterium]